MRRCATITIGDVMKKKISVCENSMVLVYILAMSGGFMDAYSYMCRGEVFANAQTGNILLMAVNLAKGNFVVALRYFAPVMAFIAGVVLAQTVHHIFKGRALHRRQIVILFEAVALFAAAFIPYELNILCNCIISLACGAQVEAFRKISIRGAYPQSYACATTMCIGNMRTAASSICEYVAHKNRDDLRKGLLLFSINAMFAIGAVAGDLCVTAINQWAVMICAVFMTMAFIIITMEEKEEEKDNE